MTAPVDPPHNRRTQYAAPRPRAEERAEPVAPHVGAPRAPRRRRRALAPGGARRARRARARQARAARRGAQGGARRPRVVRAPRGRGALARLDAEDLEGHAAALHPLLRDAVAFVREAAVDALFALNPHALSDEAHAGRLIARLDDPDVRTRRPRRGASPSTSSRSHARHVPALATLLESDDESVARGAAAALGRVDNRALEAHDAALRATLARAVCFARVRLAALNALARLVDVPANAHAIARPARRRRRGRARARGRRARQDAARRPRARGARGGRAAARARRADVRGRAARRARGRRAARRRRARPLPRRRARERARRRDRRLWAAPRRARRARQGDARDRRERRARRRRARRRDARARGARRSTRSRPARRATTRRCARPASRRCSTPPSRAAPTREAALDALGALDPAVGVAPRVRAVLARLEDDDRGAARGAARAVARAAHARRGAIPAAALATVRARLERADVLHDRRGALAALAARQRDDGDFEVRGAAARTSEAVSECGSSWGEETWALVSQLADDDDATRRAAAQALGRVKPTPFARHARASVERLDDRMDGRWSAVDAPGGSGAAPAARAAAATRSGPVRGGARR